MNRQIIWLTILGASLTLLQGCAPSVYAVDAPEASSTVFNPSGPETTYQLSFVDARDDAYTPFSSGPLPMGLTFEGADLEPISFLEEFTLAELVARGIPVSAGADDSAEVQIHKIKIRNHRMNAFGPFTTTTLMSADIVTPAGENRVGAFIVRGKVPVWGFDEVIEPTMNQPLELVVQELAAKINMHLFQQTASDADVQQLVSSINDNLEDGLAYLAVFQLGFSNNPNAIGPLVELTDSPYEYVRLASISALGTINASEHVDLLIAIFRGEHGSGHWQDRVMAVKSLCDIAVMGNDQAMAFVRNDVEAAVDGETAAGAQWAREVLGLYLRN